MSAVGQALGKIVVDPSARVRRIEDEYLRPLPPSGPGASSQCNAGPVQLGVTDRESTGHRSQTWAGERGVARTLPTAAMTTGAARLDELR